MRRAAHPASGPRPSFAAALWRGPWPVGVQRAVASLLALVTMERVLTCAGRPGDFRLYAWTGEAAVARSDLYHGCPWGACTWPPVFSLGCIPLALLSRWSEYGARALWLALNAAAIAWTMRLLAGWTSPAMRWRWWPAPGAVSPGSPQVALPLLICGRFLLVNAEFLQVNPLILGCEITALWWLARRRELAGAAALGLAAALKVLPGLLIPWLAWRGRWRAALLAALFAAAWTLLPAGWFGWSRWLDLARDWPRAVAQGWGVNGPNQSLAAMADRIIGYGVAPWNAGSFSWDFVPASGSPWVPAAVAAVALGAVAGVMALWRRPLRLETAPGLAEAGAVLGASILFAPLAWVHYFVVLLVPAAAVLAALQRQRMPPSAARGAAGLLAAACALVWLTSRAIAGPRLARVGLSLSDCTLAAVLLTGAGAWVAARSRA